jgi:hypothetical protein
MYSLMISEHDGLDEPLNGRQGRREKRQNSSAKWDNYDGQIFLRLDANA